VGLLQQWLLEDVFSLDGARDEPGQLSARSVEAALHCASGQIKNLGDLFVGEVLDVAKKDDRSLLLVEACESLLQYFFCF
jgi:hypothetical protein